MLGSYGFGQLNLKQHIIIDSGDDESNKDSVTPHSSPPYSGLLCFKGSKSPNASLYYVDYRQLKNNRNGLDGKEKSTLYSDLTLMMEKKVRSYIDDGEEGGAQDMGYTSK